MSVKKIPILHFQELHESLPECESLVTSCEQLASPVLSETNPEGCGAIQQEVDCLRSRAEAHQTAVEDAIQRLSSALQAWQHYEAAYQSLLAWIKETERKLKENILVNTYAEKKNQWQKYQVSNL